MAESTAKVSPDVRKTAARVAVFGVEGSAETVLRDCFKQFGIETLFLREGNPERLGKEKFEACIVPLDHPDAQTILEAARNSASNRRIVIYGIATDSAETRRFSRFGLNVILNRPIERAPTLKAVRSSHLLVLHELRRYVRIPVVMEITVEADRSQYTALSHEVSAGGLSMSCDRQLANGEAVALNFSLPKSGKTAVRASVCWTRPSDSAGETDYGLRFAQDDERRSAVKEWIDSYLEIR